MNSDNPLAGPNGASKWGIVAHAGFQQVPTALFMKQQALGLDNLEMLVLLNITSFWWRRDQPPYLRPKLIAHRLGLNVRSVQRVVKRLQTKGMIRRGRWTDEDGKTRPAIFLDDLIQKLETATIRDPVLYDLIRKSPEYKEAGKKHPRGGEFAFDG